MNKMKAFEVFMEQCPNVDKVKMPNPHIPGKTYLHYGCTHPYGTRMCRNEGCPMFPIVGDSL